MRLENSIKDGINKYGEKPIIVCMHYPPLLKDYKEYDKKGYVLDIELKDWENQYQAYHQLGANGVLDDRYKRLLELPDNPPDEDDISEN